MDNNKESIYSIQLTFENEDKIVDLSNAITKFIILDDYLDSNYPVIQIDIETASTIIEFVMVYKNKGKFKLSLSKIANRDFVIEQKPMTTTPLLTGLELVLQNQQFTKDNYDTDSFGGDQEPVTVNGMTLAFIPKFLLELDHENYSLCLQNVDRTNLITYLLNLSLVTDNIIYGDSSLYNISIGDLSKMSVIPQLFVPNLNFFDILDYVDNNYGLFTTKSIRYFSLFGGFIFEIKESIGTLKLKEKDTPLRIIIETLEDSSMNTDENFITIHSEGVNIQDRSTEVSLANGDSINLVGMNVYPDSKDKRYEIRKNINGYLLDYRDKSEVKLFNTANKRTFYNNKLKNIDNLQAEIEFDKTVYYELVVTAKNIDYSLLHPLREVKLSEDIEGLSKEDTYMLSQVQTEFFLDTELTNRLLGTDVTSTLYTPISILSKEDYIKVPNQPFYFSNAVFLNLIKAK